MEYINEHKEEFVKFLETKRDNEKKVYEAKQAEIKKMQEEYEKQQQSKQEPLAEPTAQ
jgi:hypothetical protein